MSTTAAMSTTAELPRQPPADPEQGTDQAVPVSADSSVELDRAPTGATVRVNGPLTTSCRVHLGEVLDWVVASGCPRCSVHLAAHHDVDLALLQLLRTTRTRLAGALSVTAGSPEQHTPLAMVGLDEATPRRR